MILSTALTLLITGLSATSEAETRSQLLSRFAVRNSIGSVARTPQQRKSGVDRLSATVRTFLGYSHGDERRSFWVDEQNPGSLVMVHAETGIEQQIQGPEPGVPVTSFEEVTFGDHVWTALTASGNLYQSSDEVNWLLRWDASRMGALSAYRTFHGSPEQLYLAAGGNLWLSANAKDEMILIATRESSILKLVTEHGGLSVGAAFSDGALLIASRESAEEKQFAVSTSSLGEIFALSFEPGEFGAIFAVVLGSDKALYRSADKGHTWEPVEVAGANPLAFSVATMAAPSERGGPMYLGTDAGLFVSYDDGRNWYRDSVLEEPATVTGIELVFSASGTSLVMKTPAATYAANNQGSPCGYEPHRYMNRRDMGRDNYIDVRYIADTYNFALVRTGGSTACEAMPYVPGSYQFVGNTKWISNFGWRYIRTDSDARSWGLPLGSYLFDISVSQNSAGPSDNPTFRQRAFYLDKQRGSYTGRTVGYTQAVSYRNRTNNSCDMIPTDGNVQPPTRNQSIVQFRTNINCPGFSGTVTFIACGGANQNISSIYVRGIGGGDPVGRPNSPLENLMAATGDRNGAWSSDRTTCVVPTPGD